jgi:hypothetical protein
MKPLSFTLPFGGKAGPGGSLAINRIASFYYNSFPAVNKKPKEKGNFPNLSISQVRS